MIANNFMPEGWINKTAVLEPNDVTNSFNGASIESSTPVDVTTPSKYLLDIAIVLLTKLPKILAKSPLILFFFL